jgi:hypothetical protein
MQCCCRERLARRPPGPVGGRCVRHCERSEAISFAEGIATGYALAMTIDRHPAFSTGLPEIASAPVPRKVSPRYQILFFFPINFENQSRFSFTQESRARVDIRLLCFHGPHETHQCAEKYRTACLFKLGSARFDRTHLEIDGLVATRTSMGPIEFVGEYFLFFPAIRALTGK